MIVLVIVVVGFWALTTGWTGLVRHERTKDMPKGAEWRPDVAAMQEAAGTGVPKVVYPAHLPSGWYANTEPRFQRGAHMSWQLGFVKGKTHYVGIKQAKGSVFSVVQDAVDTAAKRGEVVTIDSAVGRRWTSWSDADGDVAFTARRDGMTLIVWGPQEDDVRRFVGNLTTAPIN